MKENVEPVRVKKLQCIVCENDLISDIEEEQLKNIGCDHCYRWYHLKCEIPYETAKFYMSKTWMTKADYANPNTATGLTKDGANLSQAFLAKLVSGLE